LTAFLPIEYLLSIYLQPLLQDSISAINLIEFSSKLSIARMKHQVSRRPLKRPFHAAAMSWHAFWI
jgi:hypothetical protein